MSTRQNDAIFVVLFQTECVRYYFKDSRFRPLSQSNNRSLIVVVFEVGEDKPRVEPTQLNLEPHSEGHAHLLDRADTQYCCIDGDTSF